MALGDDATANCGHCFGQRKKAPGPHQILRCSRCKKDKPGAEFPTSPSKASGHHSYCRPCFIEWEKANRKAKRRAVSEREKRYYHANPGPKRALSKLNNERKPKAVYARQVIRNEIKRGRLKRGACEVCQSTFAVHGHHDDYDREEWPGSEPRRRTCARRALEQEIRVKCYCAECFEEIGDCQPWCSEAQREREQRLRAPQPAAPRSVEQKPQEQ
jgi:hypothetical protein